MVDVTNITELNAAIQAADSTASGVVQIQLDNDISLGGTALTAIDLQPGVQLVIEGNGHTLDGGGTQRGLFVYAGSVSVSDLAIDNMLAQGGTGGSGADGGGGGGAGLGGGLFVGANVAGDPGNVTLTNVTFANDAAVGGAGGTGVATFNFAGGGGGGLGGNGGVAGASGGGGGGGIGGDGGGGSGGGRGDGAAGEPGIIPGGSPGAGGQRGGLFGSSLGGGGGASGGGGGGGGTDAITDIASGGGGGGVDGGDGTAGNVSGPSGGGGAGGYGGGGGGGGFSGGNLRGRGATGGFGGGGGGGSFGGAGGFGGGGGGGFFSGAAGFGGGVGGNGEILPTGERYFSGGGGGGLGAGGDIFVQAGASLTIEGTSTAGAGTVAGGAGGIGGTGAKGGGTAGGNGQAFGSGIFLQGNESLALGTPAGDTITVAGVIADQTGSGGTGTNAGTGSLIVNQGNSGTVVLSGANTYTGGTTLDGGKLELGSVLSAGTGAITFGGLAMLQIDGTVSGTQTFRNTLVNLAVGDQIDLTGLHFDAAQPFPTAPTSTHLTVQGTNGTETFTLQNPASIGFVASDDGAGGTLITVTNHPAPSVIDTTTPGEKVAHGTTVAVGTATPGLPGDTLTLTELSGPPGAVTLSNGVVRFAAPANAGGNVTFSYQISDQVGGVTAVITDTLAVDPGPHVADTTTAGEKVAHGTTVSVGTVTPGLSGDTLTLTELSGPAGAVTLSNGVVRFAAPANASGNVTFSYRISDQLGDVSAVITDTLAVDPGPSVTDATTAGEKVAHGTTVAVGTATPGLAGDTLTLTELTGPAGAVTLSNGVVSFAAPANAGGNVTYSYRISDQLGDASAVITDTLAVDPGPSVADTTAAGEKVAHGTTVSVGTAAPGLAGDTLTLTELSGPAGAVTLANGVVSFAAPTNASGNVTFSYRISDQLGDVSAVITDTLAVDPGPSVTDTTTPGEKVAHGTTVSVGTAAPGLAGDTLTLTELSGPAGALTLTNGVVSFAAPADASGNVTFSYQISDQLGDVSAVITDTLAVDPGPSVNDSTTAGEKVGHGTTIAVGTAAPGLAGDTLTLTELTGPAGAVTLANGVVSFAAPANASGDVTFSYQISDQLGDVSAVITDTLAVDPGPHVTDTTTAGEKVAHGTTVAVGTATPGLPGDTLTLTEMSGPAGAVTLANGVVSFAAPANASGSVAFSYQISDQLGDVSAVITDTLLVDPGPTVGNAHLYTSPGLSVDLTSLVLALDTSGLPGDTLTLSGIGTAGTLGTVSLNNDDLVYTGPTSGTGSNAITSDLFTYTVSDQLHESATASVDVSLLSKNASAALTGSGNIVITTDGNRTVTGGSGGNYVSLGGGNDSVSLGGDNNTVVLGDGNDSVTLSGKNNIVRLGNGNDGVTAGDGSTITLGNGNDLVYAGANSTVVVGNGNNTVFAGADDTITLGTGHNLVAFGMNGPLAIGNEVVTGFGSGDTLEFNRQLFGPSATPMSDARQMTPDTVVITIDAHDSVTLRGVTLASLTTNSFKLA